MDSTGRLFRVCVFQHWQNVSACAIHRTCTKLFLKWPDLILLSRESYFTVLVVNAAHHDVMHSGLEATLSKTRSRYWIIRGRQTIKSILKKCATCLRWQGKPMVLPPSPDLPSYRIISKHGFQSTGTDFAGPLFVKDIYSKTAEMHKCWVGRILRKNGQKRENCITENIGQSLLDIRRTEYHSCGN